MNKRVVMGCAFLSGLLACIVDWDHIWVWVFKTQPPTVLPSVLFNISSEGRPFHTVYVFLLYALVLSIVCTAFVVRYHKSDSMVPIIGEVQNEY